MCVGARLARAAPARRCAIHHTRGIARKTRFSNGTRRSLAWPQVSPFDASLLLVASQNRRVSVWRVHNLLGDADAAEVGDLDDSLLAQAALRVQVVGAFLLAGTDGTAAAAADPATWTTVGPVAATAGAAAGGELLPVNAHAVPVRDAEIDPARTLAAFSPLHATGLLLVAAALGAAPCAIVLRCLRSRRALWTCPLPDVATAVAVLRVGPRGVLAVATTFRRVLLVDASSGALLCATASAAAPIQALCGHVSAAGDAEVVAASGDVIFVWRVTRA